MGHRHGLFLAVTLLVVSSSASAAPLVLRGTVIGGARFPISGSSVSLYTTGSSGYGDGATLLAGPVMTKAAGAFVFKLSGGCPSADALVYVVAQGGKPARFRKAAANPAIVLISMLGACGALPKTIKVDEVTTVAAAYALAQFVGESPPYAIGAPPSNAGGLANAAAAVANLADRKLGKTPAKPLKTATLPLAKLNALADILASCVASNPTTTTACTTMLNAATPNGGPAPADTLGAMLDIAHDPWNNAAGLYALVGGKPPYKPALASAPQQWALIASFAGGGLSGNNSKLTGSDGCETAARSRGLAIDALGNVWTTIQSGPQGFGLVELSPAGLPLSASTGIRSRSFIRPLAGLAFDDAQNLWMGEVSVDPADQDLVVEIPPTNIICSLLGIKCSLFSGIPAIDQPLDEAIDSNGNAWVANFGRPSNNDAGSLTELPAASNFTGGGLNQPIDVAIDGSDNVWVTDAGCSGAGCVTQAAPNIAEFQSNGTPISPSTGFMPADLAAPVNLAIGLDGHVWIADAGTMSKASSIVELDSSGNEIGSFTGGGATGQAINVAVDGAGRVWTTSKSGGCAGGAGAIVELDKDGSALASCSAFADPVIKAPEDGVAIDPSGDVWAADDGACSLIEIIGAATPTKTPLQGVPQLP